MSMIGYVVAVPASEASGLLEGDENVLSSVFLSEDPDTHVCLEKAWHALHYLLTGNAIETEGPLAFLLSGGQEVPDANTGYGPPRVFFPEEVAELNVALEHCDDRAFWSRFDAEAMTEQGIYSFHGNQPEEHLKSEYLSYFHDLKKLVAKAAARRDALVVYLV
jgi:hypothetical protein